MSERSFYFTWNRQPKQELFPVERAEHDEFILRDGRRVYDFISTSFQTSFGHSNQLICAAIRSQLDHMPIASPKATFELKERVSERLNKLFDLDGGMIFYTVSGSESVENALKMARQITGRTKVVARSKSYHGASLGALSVTGDWRNEPHFTLDEQTIRIPEPDSDPELQQTRQIVQAAGADTIAALIVETISGTNGVAIPETSWFTAVQSMCRECGIMLIIDEVLCGFGRTGPQFAYQSFDLQPDFVCTSKGITGGYIPFGAVWTSDRVVDFYDRETMACGLTNYAHPLGLAALEGVLEQLESAEFQHEKRLLEHAFGREISRLAHELGARTRQRGLLAAIELPDTSAPSWEQCFRRGLHLYSNGNMIVLAPPFISTTERLTAATQTLQQLVQQQVG